MRWKARRVGKGHTVSRRAVRRASGNIVERTKRRAQPFDNILRPPSARGSRPVHRIATRAFTGAVIAMAFVFTVAFEVVAEVPYSVEPHARVLRLPTGMDLFLSLHRCRRGLRGGAGRRGQADTRAGGEGRGHGAGRRPRRAAHGHHTSSGWAAKRGFTAHAESVTTTGSACRTHDWARGGWSPASKRGRGEGGRGDEVGCSTEDRPERGEWRVACRTRR